MKNIISLCICICILGGCCKKEKLSIHVDYIEDAALSIRKNIQADTLKSVDTLIYAKEFLVYKDSVLIVLNNKHKDGYFIEFYSLPNIEIINKLYRLGDGPNELLSAKVDLNKDQLIVNDYVKAQVAIVDMDSILIDSLYSPLPRCHKAFDSPTAIPYKGMFLLENPYYFTDLSVGIEQNTSRFIITKGEKTYVGNAKYRYYTRNVVVNGRIITNEKENRIIYANMYKSEIEVYDMDLNLLKKIEGPVDLKPLYAIEGEKQYNVSFREYIPYGYLDYCVDENFFYLTYVGKNLVEGQKMKDLSCYILKFDWNGNFIDCYPINSYILSMSKGQKENVFYVTTLSEDDAPMLIKLQCY